MMTAKPRLVVPYGLKTLLEGLSRAVLRIQPPSIAQFACIYFTELLQFRDANPSLDIKDLVREFQHGKVEGWQEGTDILDFKRMTPLVTEKVLRDAGVLSPLQDQRAHETSPSRVTHDEMTVSLKDSIGTETSEESGIILHHEMAALESEPSHYSCLHRDISNPLISCPEWQDEECGDAQAKAVESKSKAAGEPKPEVAKAPTPEAVTESKPEEAHEATPEAGIESAPEEVTKSKSKIAGEPAPEAAGEPSPEAAGAPTPEAAGAPTPEAAGAPTPEMAGAPTPEMAGAPTPETAGAPTPETAGAPTPETAGAPTPETAGAPTPEAAGAPTPEAAAAPTPEAAAAPTPEAAAAPTPEAAAAPTPEAAAAPTPEAAAAPTPEAAAAPTPEAVGAPTPEAAGEPTPEAVGAPSSEAVGAPSSVAVGAPSSVTVGAPSSVAVGTPSSVAVGAPSSVAVGAPSSVAVGTPSSVAVGAPSSVAVGTPTPEVAGEAKPEVAGEAAPEVAGEALSKAADESKSTAKIESKHEAAAEVQEGKLEASQTEISSDKQEQEAASTGAEGVTGAAQEISPDAEAPTDTDKVILGAERMISKSQLSPDTEVTRTTDKTDDFTERVDRVLSKTSQYTPESISERVDRVLSKTSQKSEAMVSRISDAEDGTTVEKTDKSSRSSQTSISEKVDRGVSKTFKVLADNIAEKIDRMLSKTSNLTSEKSSERMDRPVSKTSVTSAEKVSEKIERTISKSPEKMERTTSKTLSPEKFPEKVERKVSTIRDDKGFEKAERVISQATQLGVSQVDVLPSSVPSAEYTTPRAIEVVSAESAADTTGKAESVSEVAKVTATSVEPAVESVTPETVSSAYLPAQDTVVARIVRATSDTYTTLEPKLIQVEPPPTGYYGQMESSSKTRISDFSKGPPTAPVVQDVPVCEEVPPCYIEQIPQEILVPSQKGPKQPGDYVRQLRTTAFQYQGPPPTMAGMYRSPADSATYRTAYSQSMPDMPQWTPDRGFMEDNRYYTTEPYTKRAEDMAMRDQSGRYMRKECDQSNLWTLYRLTDLNQPNMHPQNMSAPHPQSGLYFPNIQQPRHQEPPMNQQYVQRTNYMDTQHMTYPNMNSVRMVSSPAYVLPEEPKTKVNCPPFILVGSTIQEPHEWKPIPGHAVLSKNDLCSQRKYTTVPVPVAVSPNPMCSNLGQDMNLPSAPLYLSVAVPMDEAQRMSATQSYIHVSSEQRNMPPYVGPGMSVAQAAAASRRPSAIGVGEHRNLTNGRSATQNLVEGRSGESIKNNNNA
ncbi:calcium-binding tyrosine phosphorylation-regulated protein [Microcaecilia unicolor]|uniref:Calcium-binding tyrosine phosphorylation-regulated protein n=1 Tax=Microcaecilia unicolor TaxID=1415580 RepID=A0A6P7WLC5_9AMPH|nr:calcium-binding tyrosine phosphorylation-regulated protein [Microcaecilia unicolor]